MQFNIVLFEEMCYFTVFIATGHFTFYTYLSALLLSRIVGREYNGLVCRLVV